jgi:hypothetical protein
MTRHIIELNATRLHRVRMYARLPGAPVPGPLEDLPEIDQQHWDEARRAHEATAYLDKR